MAVDYKSYLATQVVSEKQTVSYRNVSRALKVHVNSAKCMLYDFWEKENKKKQGSVYATYLIAGFKRHDVKLVLKNGDVDRMDEEEPAPSDSAALTSSMMDLSQRTEKIDDEEDIPIKTISLVREEDLQSIKEQYETVTSIHMYSLSPGRLQDLVVLTDIGRGIMADSFLKEDPLKSNKVYGVIQNPAVRRRTGRKHPIPEAPKPKFQPTKPEKNAKKEETKSATANLKTNETKQDSRPGSRDSSVSAASNKGLSLKRESSSLFKAFAKGQNKSKLAREDTDASTNASVSGAEDTPMPDADEEGESEDEALFLDTGTKKPASKKRTSDMRKEREDKTAKLRKMMDSDDEEEKALPNVEDATGIKEEPPAAKDGLSQADRSGTNAEANDEEVAWSDSDTEQARQKAPATDASTSKDGDLISTEPRRRRGKRKVMKKKTMKDDEGFLVTKEEAVWESFSEDDPEPAPKAKDKPKPASSFSSTTKSQSGGSTSQKPAASSAKEGTQKKKGDIMSFFGKK